jgi:sigma-E factor negative regulatory protein RseB
MYAVLAMAIDGHSRRSFDRCSLLLKTSVLAVVFVAAISGNTLADAKTESAAGTDASSAVAKELIEKMSDALRTLNYEGVFVHAQGANLTSMHIVHANKDNDEFERLLSLDGEAREVLRTNSLVTCIWPGSESVVVSKSTQRDLLPTVDAGLTSNMRYSFHLGDADRVAGREADVVHVMPQDRYRYGYRFWIDRETRMLLRSMLLDGPGNPVEQVIFTQIEFPETIDIAQFDPMSNYPESALATWLEPNKEEALLKAEKRHSEQADKVRFASLPDGYRKTSETFSAIPSAGKAGPSSHVMLSDGMASVSVYVEYVAAVDHSSGALGLVKMGAMNAYGVSTENALITVVGEVPETTIRAIASAVIIKE